MELERSIMRRLEEEAASRERLLGVAVDRADLAGRLIAERLDDINGEGRRANHAPKGVLQVIKRAGKKGIARNALSRSLFNMRSKEISIVLEALIKSGQVVETMESGRGRPTTVYTAASFVTQSEGNQQ